MRISTALLLLSATCASGLREVSHGGGEDAVAAKELRRYIYQMTGELPEIVDNSLVANVRLQASERYEIRPSDHRGHSIKRFTDNSGTKRVQITGKTPEARLNGVYSLLHQFGVRFGMDADRVPNHKSTNTLPSVDDVIEAMPTFDYRGLQPFHDFPEGPDWWNTEMYMHVINQISKLKMNFLGLHTYPYTNQTTPVTGKNEPTVWVGTTDNLDKDGNVLPSGAYMTSYANTERGEWGYNPMKTSDFSYGADQIFESDCFATKPTTAASCPYPKTPRAQADFFNSVSTMFQNAFSLGDSLHVQTCVGTETPLSKPKGDISTQDYYEGMFTRLQKTIPSLDWYWVWTPEAWEWGSMNSSNPVFTNAVDDLKIAMQVHDKLNLSWNMATNGWVVGPLPDRSIFDKTLGPEWDAITSIDLKTGHSPVDPSYKNITNHKKWAIPWMEDDPNLGGAQLWVNRTLEHMEDAKAYGCNGLLGIHWRTKMTSPQIEAMAAKSWNSSLQSHDFWVDWCTSNFGANVAATCAGIFDSVDSFNMPVLTNWINGPGQMTPVANCSSTTPNPFAHAATLSNLLSKVSDPIKNERLQYWVDTFNYMHAVFESECLWGSLNAVLAEIKAAPESQRQQLAKTKGLPARIALITKSNEMANLMINTISTPGEMGTFMNWETRSLHEMLNVTGTQLAGYLKSPLPSDAMPSRVFSARSRVFVPVQLSSFKKGGLYTVSAIRLSTTTTLAPPPMMLSYTCMGAKMYNKTEMTNIGRSVFEASFTLSCDAEFYVESGSLVYPVGGANNPFTVVAL
eukprot:TRINITY_DN10_c2_g2_i2.p1 TRINITY_DN10_c2_g2~~TRINITY_DN10_c2_g2_i2.p1  ORF type:complete len:818 (+),score=150.23 TRINITY_DN10_c2_g2_i2:72-2456(+)